MSRVGLRFGGYQGSGDRSRSPRHCEGPECPTRLMHLSEEVFLVGGCPRDAAGIR